LSGRVPWDELSDSAQDAIADIIELLAEKFTGEIALRCKEGRSITLKLTGGEALITQLKEARRIRKTLTVLPDND
jgi:hypothetical protein|tara:strand:+ start:5916 stop:6140 length:225 start_codon:yes stop_codon:yes gene_type:complete